MDELDRLDEGGEFLRAVERERDGSVAPAGRVEEAGARSRTGTALREGSSASGAAVDEGLGVVRVVVLQQERLVTGADEVAVVNDTCWKTESEDGSGVGN